MVAVGIRVAVVRDAFGFLDFRLQLMLAQDRPTFASWDQDALALELDYRVDNPVGRRSARHSGIFSSPTDSMPCRSSHWRRYGTRG